jgi:NAD(P)-dependent dehydrogenase (short-subunit alcohol dehydrogenase family)
VEGSLSGKTVFVTGAARGIGAASAKALAERGMRVSLTGLEPERLAEVAEACGPEAIWFEADVTDRDAIQRAVSETVERHGGIDVVIANAGIASGGLVRITDPAEWERVIEVNLLGVFRTVHACLPHVIERRGYILPVASVAAAIHAPGLSAYSASKAGVEALADALRLEVAHLGVSVGCAYFSWIATDMVAGGDAHPLAGHLRGRLRGPFARTYPLSDAVAAVVRGVERRSRRVVAPRWVGALLAARTLAAPIAERDVRDVMPEVDAAALAAVERMGATELSKPVGAGGAADAEARRARSEA